MAISGMLIQPRTDAVSAVAKALSDIEGVTVHSVTPQQEIIIVVEAASLQQISEVARTLETIPGVLGVFPTYITTADEQEDEVN
ncbi:chaperone NapD [Sporomusa acidovorans]|uniref:Chaperone NapD n=1 Tax=Sporomusa acidovorans (strain ATCC 49682 / DSM 3132 / Mol) TaxID=1123286 RepID=A0ABZ3J9P9_SPOA4|nr:chaperone NapD [Sporomusa acidovorans]OZC21768.1 NapD protein [Sporomusa acidovorans DSM 3132]SDD57406.1 periplasmic nitrate reductase chaperone NapD [Sporomusa acidovorans]